jgi:RNA polymerase sigma-70 factor (ECF subfamily)
VKLKALADTGPSPDAALEQHEIRRLLESSVALLPLHFRTVFVLRQVEGLSLEETADYLGIPIATVKTRDHRARGLLRNYLGEQIEALVPHTFTFGSTDCDHIVAQVLARLRQ